MIKIYFDNVLIDENYYAEITNDYSLFSDTFHLGSVSSNVFKVKLAKSEVTTKIPSEVKIEDDNTVFFLTVDSVEEDKSFYTYTLLDKMILFGFNYDASGVVPTTLQGILEDICSKAGIQTDYVIKNTNITVDWYDNRVSAREYISMIAELESSFAYINENGKLDFKNHNQPSLKTISTDEISELILGEHKVVSRVVYDNGVNIWEFGNETGITIYLNTDNVFITTEEQVEYIYDEIVNFEFWTLNVPNSTIDSNIRAGDIITFTDGTNNYKTIAQYSSSFGGSTWVGSYDLTLQTKKQQETQVVGINEKVRSIKTEIDRANASLEIIAEEIETVTTTVEKSVKSTKSQYYLSTSNSSPTGGSWSDIAPTWETGKYMFTRTMTTLTDNTVVYSPSANGTLLEGLKGKDGANGQSQYTYIRYSVNSNGNPMTTTPNANTKYIGIAVTTSATAPSSYGDYTWSKYVGEDGQDGQQGIPGTPGANGVTTYTWIKYADDINGTNLSDNPTGKTYIGLAHNKTTATESTTPGDYTWSLIKGTDGTDGQGVVGITAQYYLSTSIDEPIGDSWNEAQPIYEEDKFLWIRYKIDYTNPTSTEYTEPQLDTTWEEIKNVNTQVGNIITRTASLEVTVGGEDGAGGIVGTVSDLSETYGEFRGELTDLDGKYNIVQGDVSLLTQRANALDLKFQRLGGANLIIDSVGHYSNSTVWTNMHDSISNSDIFENTISKNAWHLMNRKAVQVLNQPAGTYTVSIKYKKLSSIPTVRLIVNGTAHVLTSTSWSNFNYTFTTTGNEITVELESDSNNAGYISDLILNPQDIPFTWQPANGESILGNVRMSQAGIDVKGMTNNRVTLSEDGLRGYYEDNIVMKSTNSGMYTKEIEAGSGNIANLIIVDVDGQTWLSRR